ncbi:MAG: hypothetical protein L6243_07315 [Candidatus Altiarchaeales archaeon]|nr:hypothetical protein [Candidatus Altiarchaeota archaeon]MBU4341516.1 hypothetical protein [Candidatus Altiarchaeota archaeon]MBU4406228.1 hypothetical protein [Candidatus Altiarchaeota archaeon]MBU4436657.1 hypothetical protein [Candidatus Altiarchaeota archaeon]MCG2783380.1 hypothetical protein [Candidatus Altiarchaeales archaeon]
MSSDELDVPSPEDMVAAAAEGATRGALEFSKKETIKLLKFSKKEIGHIINRLKNRELYFLEDEETIDVAKEMRQRSEYSLFSQYVKDKNLRILFQMGLTLRDLEFSENEIKLKKLVGTIRDKYTVEGLHAAYFVQNGLFSKYLGNVLERPVTSKVLSHEIEDLFNNMDDFAVFVKGRDDVDQRVREIINKIDVKSPKTFIISGIGSATESCEKITKKVMDGLSDYESETYNSEVKKRRIYFLNRIDDEGI